MADDIDDLLDNFEDNYHKKDLKSKKKRAGIITDDWDSSDSENSSKQTPNKNNEISDLLDELSHTKLDDDGGSHRVHRGASMKECSSKQFKQSEKLMHRGSSLKGPSAKKCFPVFLGGSLCECGLSTTVKQRCCDELRCTDCDFHIESFDGHAWDTSVDYLFLRNNMPDRVKLKSKLITKQDSRAYSCQCKWKSVSKMTNLQSCMELKWVCGKH